MGAIPDAEGSVQMLIDLHPALGKGITPSRGGDLPSGIAELNAIVVGHGSLML